MNNQNQDYDFIQKMRDKNRFTTNSNINNPVHNSEFYISENDRLFGDNFATGEYYRRKQENEKKKEKYKLKQNQLFERERKRWEKLDYEYLRKENQSMMNKEKNLVGRKNNPGMAFNPLNCQYDNSVQGEILKRRDEESKYRAWLRSVNIDKHGNTGYNIINGEERTILEKRLNKDIVPDLIQKNIDQINEMKNKVVFNYNNFYTRCDPLPPEFRGYRYDNSNMNGNYNYNGNRNNKSVSTPNIVNNNGGRYRAPIDLRNERNLNNNAVNGSNILPRGRSVNNINDFNKNNDYNNYNNMNNRNAVSPLPRSPRYEMNDINNNMNNNNFYNNERNNNMNMNNNMNNDMNMNNNMNNNINDNNQYNNGGNNNAIPNVGIIDLNNMDMNEKDRLYPREQNNNNINNNNYMDNNINNNNTLNNNNFMENINDLSFNPRNQLNNLPSENNNNNANLPIRTPNNNNIRDNGNNDGRNDFYYKGNATNVNNVNNNLEQRDYAPIDYQPPVQSNYNVNPYNPYARPDFYLMNK